MGSESRQALAGGGELEFELLSQALWCADAYARKLVETLFDRHFYLCVISEEGV